MHKLQSMSVANLLSKLNDINNTNLIDIYVPSLQRVVKFKRLTAKQQRDLIQTGLDGATSGLSFNIALNRIITECSCESVVFSMIDKVSIAVALRVNAFGSKFKNEDDEDLDLTSIITQTPTFTNISKDLKLESIEINISVPTLNKDSDINHFAIQDFKKTPDMQVSSAIGSLYLYEIVKYINTISVDGELIDTNKLNIKERLTIVDVLPASLLNEVISYIQSVRTDEDALLTVDNQTVPLDSRLFAIA